MILSPQRAFQLEEARVASTKAQKMYARRNSDISEYYRRAFLPLNPMLLPKIFTSVLGVEPMTGVRTDRLVYLLAKIFQRVYPMEDSESASKRVPEILQSKPDKIVVTEIFRNKAFEQACQLVYPSESSPTRDRRETDDDNQRRSRISCFSVPRFLETDVSPHSISHLDVASAEFYYA